LSCIGVGDVVSSAARMKLPSTPAGAAFTVVVVPTSALPTRAAIAADVLGISLIITSSVR
jgi:hypothetical protein